jgi:hypothetical protein
MKSPFAQPEKTAKPIANPARVSKPLSDTRKERPVLLGVKFAHTSECREQQAWIDSNHLERFGRTGSMIIQITAVEKAA